MSIIYRDLKEALLKLAIQYGGDLTQDLYDKGSFGNFVVEVTCESFVLRIVNDRSFLVVELAAVADRDCWWDFETVTTFVDKNFRFERGNKLLETTRTFFQSHFGLLVDLFNQENYSDTKRKLQRIERSHLL